MADKLPNRSKDAIVQGLHECFAVNKNVVKAILDAENWNIENCLRLLEAMSPKVTKKPGDKAQNSKTAPNHGNVSGKKKTGNNGKNGSSRDSTTNLEQKENKTNSATKAGSSNNIPKAESSNNIPKAGSSNNIPKAGSSKTKAKNEQKPDAGNKNNPESKKSRRAMLKSAYDIIKQKGNPSDRIRDYIKFEIRVIVLMRGCPGSGKSSYARHLLELNGVQNPENYIFSTDNYFIDSKGNYNYDKNNIDKAHSWNQELVEKMMKIGVSPVVVDNTHVKAWEMMCYAQYAVRLGYVLETIEPPTPWFFNESILAKKNTHGVPKDKISIMLQNYEPNLTGDVLLKKFNIDYTIQLCPPQTAIYCPEAANKALNKAMGKRRLPVPLKSTQNNRDISKNNIQKKASTGKYPDIEILSKVPLNCESVNNTLQKQPLNKNNLEVSQIFKNDNFNNGFVEKDEKVESQKCSLFYNDESSTRQSISSTFSERFAVNSLHLNSENSFTLIDNPLDDNGVDGLANPLTPEKNFTSNLGAVTSSIEPSILSFDSSNFPSLSRATGKVKTVNSNGDFKESRIYEEKINKLTELFPHLDKEYISDLAVDPNKSLDDLVGILLDSTNNLQIGNSSEPQPVVARFEEESNFQDERGAPLHIDKEKDIGMLIQLFPNITECKIRKMYKDCNEDFKISLEWLLHSEPSETSSEVNETFDSISVGDQENEDIYNSLYSSNDQFDQIVKTFKEFNVGNKKSAEDFSNLYSDDNIPLENTVKEIKVNDEDWVFCESSESYSQNETKFHEPLKKEKQPVQCSSKYEGIALPSEEEANASSSAPTYDINNSGNREEVHIASEGCPIEETSKVLITHEEVGEAVKNALSSLRKNSANFCASDVDKDSKSDLLSKLLEWEPSSVPENIIKEDGTSAPKDQRCKFNNYNSLMQNSSTNTNYKDFEELKKAQFSGVSAENILEGSLNFVSCPLPSDNALAPKSKLMLDKGISTVEVETGFSPSNNTGACLSSMFPTIPSSDLDALLKSCVGDLNWAVGLLLDSGHEISPNFNPSEFDVVDSGNGVFGSDSNQLDESLLSTENGSSLSDFGSNTKSKKRYSYRVPAPNINYVMNDESISSHVKKIRNARLGIAETSETFESSNQPSTSGLSNDTIKGSGSSDEDDEEVETLDIALSTNLVLALQALFGGYIPNIDPDNQVVVNLPVYLARQLHSCIMESLTKHLLEDQKFIDKMIEEDECLARQLQELENGSDSNVPPPSIQDIMDEELAVSMHNSSKKGKSGDGTWASKLSCQLLIERFPSMDPLALKTILEDTNHSLDQATHLLEAAGYTRANTASNPSNVVEKCEDKVLSRDEALEQAGAYREAAKAAFQMRQDCFQKAQKAYMQGNKDVASYYSQMANWHNQRIEQANLLASTMLLDGNNNVTTLDLHFLRVREAVQVLDLFLDAHISNMIDMKHRKRKLYIITGRGLHSADGKSKIRPVTMNRLKERSIWHQLINPGLLLVELTYKTPLAYQN